jgi:hypothetical protein
MLICLVGLVVLRVELQRGTGGPIASQHRGGNYVLSCLKVLRRCLPEVTGLLIFIACAAYLRLRAASQVPADKASAAAWARITAEWPLLLGADTLLALQAMLRLVVLLAAALRKGVGASRPLADEAAGLWLGSAVARVVLYTRSPAYQLDGPLGGQLPATCDMVTLVPLLLLSYKALFRAPLTVVLTMAASVLYSVRNHVSLSGNYVTDGLFTLAHTYDFFAAFAYLLRTLLIDQKVRNGNDSIAIGFAHLLMPVQALLSAYYFLTAFDADADLVGAGKPFEVLKVSTCVQFGAYTIASAVYVADLLQGSANSGGATTSMALSSVQQS